MHADFGLPTSLAAGVLVGEVLAPLLVLANVMAVPAVLLMAFNMVVAVSLDHSLDFSTLSKNVAGR